MSKNGTQYNFDRNFSLYYNGFQDKSGNMWLGLKNISDLFINKKKKNVQNKMRLRIELKNEFSELFFIEYENFFVDDNSKNFQMTVGDKFNGNLRDKFNLHSGSFFSARNEDRTDGYKCGTKHGAGWWFLSQNPNCYNVCLTCKSGQYNNEFSVIESFKYIKMMVKTSNC